MTNTPFQNLDVAAVYQNYEPEIREKLLTIREWIFETAQSIPQIQHIEESLKWGEPSYRAVHPRTGTSVRLSTHNRDEESFGVYFICTSGMVDIFRLQYGDRLQYDGKRALVFTLKDKLPQTEIQSCIRQALTSKI
jgi:hypothetical protein